MFNQATLIGRLGKDPEVRQFPSGNYVVKFTLATWKSYQKDGQWETQTEWHNIEYFTKHPESVKAKKGDTVFVLGEIQYQRYQAQDGTEKYITKIIAKQIKLLKVIEPQAEYQTPTQQIPTQQAKPAQASRQMQQPKQMTPDPEARPWDCPPPDEEFPF